MHNVTEQLELKEAFQLTVVCQQNVNADYSNKSEIYIELISFSQPKYFSSKAKHLI